MSLSAEEIAGSPSSSEERRTAWIVLAALFAFFGTMFVANGALVYYAFSTFSGEEEASPYEHGLAYDKDIEAARAQEARGWNVTLGVQRPQRGAPASVAVAIRDANNEALAGLNVSASFEFPTDNHLDRRASLIEIQAGEYRGEVPLRAGRWDVVIEATGEGERLFRSRNRVTLP
jgi:nitrogen fixation protein FixH